MIPVINDIDRLLQAAPVRLLNPNNADIILTPSAPGFHVDAAGNPDIDSITVTATLIGLEGDISFSVQGAALSVITDKSVTLTYASILGGLVILTATVISAGEEFTRQCVIPTLRDGGSGSGAKVVTLTPSAQVFKINKAGVNDIASITLDAVGQNTAGTPNFTIPAGTATLSAGASSSQKILTFANMASDSVTVRVMLDGQTDQVTIIKVREGIDGNDAIAAVLSNESVTLTADAAGAVASLSGAVCTMQVYKGIVDDSAAWTYAYAPPSSAGGLAYTVEKNTITVTGLAAGMDVAFVDITASRSGFASITKRFSVSKSKAGAGGTGTVGDRGAGQYWAIGSSWSDVVADMATPGSNMIGDQVTIADGTVTYTKRWDGDSWEVPGGYLSDSLFVEKGITAAKINTNGLDIRTPGGELILGSGSSLAAQSKTNPNLVPRISSWPTGSRYGGANWFRNTLGHPALNGELISLPPGQGYVGYESDALRIPPNVYYTVSFDAHCYNGAQGVCVDVYGPNVDSVGAVLNLTSTPTRYKFTEIMTVPEAPSARLRVFALGGPGVAEIYNIKVEFGIKDTAWCDNVITRENVSTFIKDAAIGLALIDRASIANLSALVAYLGSVQLGVGGALWTGQEAYDTGVGLRLGTNAADDPYLSMRSASDKYLRIRPKSDVFEASKWTIINPDLQLADRVASISSSPGDAFAHWHATTSSYCGSHTAGISNPVNPSYAWSISSIAVQAQFSLGSTTNAQTTVYVAANGAFAGDEVECMITCTISDGGTTVAISKIIYVTFT